MIGALKCFVRDERAATSIEYALIATGISITIIAAVQAMGTSVKDRYIEVSNSLASGN